MYEVEGIHRDCSSDQTKLRSTLVNEQSLGRACDKTYHGDSLLLLNSQALLAV